MSTPTDDDIKATFRQLRRLADRTAEARALEAVRRQRRGGPSTPDGFPSAHGGGGGRGGAELTSVESAAAARLAGRGERDLVADHVEQLVGYLDQAIASLKAAAYRGNAVAALADAAPDTSRGCAWHADAGTMWIGDLTYGTVGGRLAAAVDLCDACYGFAYRHNGERPEIDSRGRLRRHVADSRKATVDEYRSGADLGQPVGLVASDGTAVAAWRTPT